MARRKKQQSGHAPGGRTGRIVKQVRGGFTVSVQDNTIECVAAGRLTHNGGGPSATIAVGDEVRFVETDAGRGRITSIQPRRNVFARRAAGPRRTAQVIAANVDQLLVVVAAAEPAPSWAMLDRYLVIAEASGIPAAVCITKADLVDVDRLRRDLPPYEALGYPVMATSPKTGLGVDAVRRHLAGRTTVLAGKSGVGKTSLLNAVVPALNLSVGQVNGRTGKGRHTTTWVEAFPIAGSGLVIDTPGVRELGLWDIDPGELAGAFPELRPLFGQCRFGADCRHTHEPGCAVKSAVADGAVHPQRYRSYLKMANLDSDDVKHEADTERKATRAEQPFTCGHCGWTVPGGAPGTNHRNHCPNCLWSAHVDVRPGDRAAGCDGPMEPIAVWLRSQREWALVHRCRDCGAIRANRIAGDDNEVALMSLAVRALAQPPFPLDRLASS